MRALHSPPLSAQISMFFADVRKDSVRRRMVTAAGALMAAVIVAVLAAGILFQARRRAERDVLRAVDDQASYGARLMLDEVTRFSRTTFDLLDFATRRGTRTVAAPAETLLARVRYEQTMSLEDPRYTDSLRAAFTFDPQSGRITWAADAALPSEAFRTFVVDTSVGTLRREPAGMDYDAITIPWHGENVYVWLIAGRDGAGRLSVVNGAMFSRTRFLSRYVPIVLRRVPILPASVAGARWNVEDPRADQQPQHVALRLEDVGTGLVEYETEPLVHEGAVGSYARTLGNSRGSRVRLALSDTITNLLIAGSPTPISEKALWILVVAAALLALCAVLVARRAFIGLSQRQRFLATVSHELRTPLTQVRLSVETLRRCLPVEGDERRRRTLEALDRGTEQLTRTVENLLALAKSELPTWRVRPRPTDLEALVRGAIETISPLAATRRVSFEVTAPTAVWGSVDPDAFRQVVLNLLDNAVKYGPRGQAVRLRLRAYNDTAEVSIADHGPGIPLEHRARIWQPFERVTEIGTLPTRDGLGLGLSVVRDIVARHNGWVRVEDGIDGGATFVVGVPAAMATEIAFNTAEFPVAAGR